MKKLYYRIDDGDYCLVMELDGCMEYIKNSMQGMNEEETLKDEPCFTISPEWMTEEEFDALPEAE